MILKDRSALADIANALGINLMIEVGTHQAVFASEFMRRFRGSIICVDPWEGFDENPTFYPAFDEESRERTRDMQIAIEAMREFGDRAAIVRLPSNLAEQSFSDNTVGMVYVDALHDYDSVSYDTKTWFSKVTKGGIIAGHDYRFDYPGVVQAVTELCAENNLQLNITNESMPSWWAIKQ